MKNDVLCVSVSLCSFFLFSDFFQQFIYGCFQLCVFSFHNRFGSIQHIDVGVKLGVFQIASVGEAIAYHRNAEFTLVMVPGTGAPTSLPSPRCLYTHGVPCAFE